MNVRWQKLFLSLSAWFVLELVLGFLGLDNIADYSEFLFPKPELALIFTP